MAIPNLEAADRMRSLPEDIRDQAIDDANNVCDGRLRFGYHRRQQELADAYRSPKTPKPD